MAKKEIEIGQKCAFIRENALVLYFDKAETPFVARYDLDSLAQANFEVMDKQDGLFTLRLRDYSGRSQDVGQFANKADAHQALYTILQALLEHKTTGASGTCGSSILCRIGCGLGRLLKWILLIVGFLAVLYFILGLIPVPTQRLAERQEAVVSDTMIAPQSAPSSGVDLSTIPEGEAVDADALFGGAAVTGPQSQDSSDMISE